MTNICTSICRCCCSFNVFTYIVTLLTIGGIMIGTSIYRTQKNYKQVQPLLDSSLLPILNIPLLSSSDKETSASTNVIVPSVMWATVGGITSSQAQIRLRLEPTPQTTYPNSKLVVFESNTISQDNSNADIVSETFLIDLWDDTSSLGIASFTATNLTSSTIYTYQFVIDSSLQVQPRMVEGTFRTPPLDLERETFSIVTAGCAWTGSYSRIFEEASQVQIQQNKNSPIMMIQLGDLHYTDYNGFELNQRLLSYDTVFDNTAQNKLWNSMAITHMWDDHDYLGNDSSEESNQNSDGKSTRQVALEGYTLGIPHYEPLPAASSSTEDSSSTFVAPYQAFTIGTVRFIMSDLRSECRPTQNQLMSSEQKTWLYDEITNALSDDSGYDYVVWITTKPWNGPEKEVEDPESWKEFPDERRQLSNHILSVLQENPSRQPSDFLIISSDAHMVGFDDGSNTYYGDTTSNSTTTTSFSNAFVPILHSGPMDRVVSIKGTPLSDGCYTSTGTKLEPTSQYSVVEFSFPDENIEEEDAGLSNNTTASSTSTSPCISVTSYTFDYTVIYQRTWCQDGFVEAFAGGSSSQEVNHNIETNCSDPAITNTKNYAMLGIVLGIVALLIPSSCYCMFRSSKHVKTEDDDDDDGMRRNYSNVNVSHMEEERPKRSGCCSRDSDTRNNNNGSPLCFSFGMTLLSVIIIGLSIGLSGYVPSKILNVGMLDSTFILGMAVGQSLVALLFVWGWSCQYRRRQRPKKSKKKDRLLSSPRSAEGDAAGGNTVLGDIKRSLSSNNKGGGNDDDDDDNNSLPYPSPSKTPKNDINIMPSESGDELEVQSKR